MLGKTRAGVLVENQNGPGSHSPLSGSEPSLLPKAVPPTLALFAGVKDLPAALAALRFPLHRAGHTGQCPHPLHHAEPQGPQCLLARAQGSYWIAPREHGTQEVWSQGCSLLSP